MSPRVIDDAVVERLEADGFVRRDAGCYRTTRRWQSAMARAAFRLFDSGETGPGGDLRVPIGMALLELYGLGLSDAEIAERVEAMLPIEQGEFDSSSRVPVRDEPRAGGEAR